MHDTETQSIILSGLDAPEAQWALSSWGVMGRRGRAGDLGACLMPHAMYCRQENAPGVNTCKAVCKLVVHS